MPNIQSVLSPFSMITPAGAPPLNSRTASDPRARWSRQIERQVQVGRGDWRDALAGRKAAAADFLGKVAKGVGLAAGGLIAAASVIGFSPVLLPLYAATRFAKSKMARLEEAGVRNYKVANQGQLALLRVQSRQSKFGDSHEAVMTAVVDYARKTGKLSERADGGPELGKLTEADLRDLVAIGEGVITRVGQAEQGQRLTLPGSERPLASAYTAKAVAWFLIAQAASQNLPNGNGAAQAGSGQVQAQEAFANNMATKGSFVMKDPGNKLYDFLKSVPEAGHRMSTHVRERSGAGVTHMIAGVLVTGNPQQWGIEDYQSTFPGAGGNMLFDKLIPSPGSDTSELFLRFESAGCPPYFVSSPSPQDPSQLASGQESCVVRFFAAMGRNIDHSTNFLKSRDHKQATKAGQVNRHEHVHKGVLKKPVAEPFKDLIKDAVAQQILAPSALTLTKGMKTYGLPFVSGALAEIKNKAQSAVRSGAEPVADPRSESAKAIADRCDGLLEQIQRESDRLQTLPGVERRGAEVHLDLGLH